MQIEIETSNLEFTQALQEVVQKSLERIEKRWGERLTSMHVYIKDTNSPSKGGMDKHCTFETRPAGLNPVTVGDTAVETYEAIRSAAKKLEHAHLKILLKSRNLIAASVLSLLQ